MRHYRYDHVDGSSSHQNGTHSTVTNSTPSDTPLTAHARTHVGLVRGGNEDAYHLGEVVFAVADGLGGHAAGEVASALAVARLEELDPSSWDGIQDAQEQLADAVAAANHAVYEAAAAEPEHAGMGTTLTAAAVHAGRLLLAHVGDSRAYLFREGEGLRQVTTDHTAAQQAVEAGQLTAEQAARHPHRHVLARAVGLDPDVDVDTPEPIALVAGDRVLLCSDGLIDPVDDDGIEGILNDQPGTADACEALVGAALEGGGPDNVTVVLVDVHAA